MDRTYHFTFHLVVLTIQPARSLTLANLDTIPSRVRGYFHQWEDYALFSLHFLHVSGSPLLHGPTTHSHFRSIECFARICASGLIDPDVPSVSIFTSPFRPSEDEPIRSAATPGLARTPSMNRSGIARTRIFGQVTPDGEQLLQAVCITSQTAGRHYERWCCSNYPHSIEDRRGLR